MNKWIEICTNIKPFYFNKRHTVITAYERRKWKFISCYTASNLKINWWNENKILQMTAKILLNHQETNKTRHWEQSPLTGCCQLAGDVHSSGPFMETLSRNCSISSLEKESLYGHRSLNNNHHCAMKNRYSNTNLIFFYNKVPRMACQRNMLCYLPSYQQGFLVNPSRIWLTQLFGFFSKSRAYAW